MSNKIDHLVIAGGDLDRLVAWFADASGVVAQEGGRHESLGTKNALVSLGPIEDGQGQYLELVAPDPAQPAPNGFRPFGIDGLGPEDVKLAAMGVSVEEIDVTVARLAESEAVPGPVHKLTRRRPDGELVEWRIAFPLSDRQQGVVPFLIEWSPGSEHPSVGLEPSCTLTGVTLQHPEPDLVSSALDNMDLEAQSADLIEVASGQPAIISAMLETPKGTLLL